MWRYLPKQFTYCTASRRNQQPRARTTRTSPLRATKTLFRKEAGGEHRNQVHAHNQGRRERVCRSWIRAGRSRCSASTFSFLFSNPQTPAGFFCQGGASRRETVNAVLTVKATAYNGGGKFARQSLDAESKDEVSGGKSGPHRAGCRLTAGRREATDSATERYRLSPQGPVRVKWWGKSPPRFW